MHYQLIDFFTDPILRGPTLGSMFMCAAASLVGVIVFIRRKSLVGETLSHAAYPGLIISAVILSAFFSVLEEWFSCVFLLGAFISCLLGLAFLRAMQTRFLVKSDAALCFVLSSFFGIGVLFASRLQFSHPLWYRQIQVFLYGQTATLLDIHIWVYGIFFLFVLLFITVFYRPIQLVYFDREFAQSIGITPRQLDGCFFFLLALAVTIAMKSVGVVLLSGMFIAPALAARRMTHKLSSIFVIACFIAALSAFLGNYFSIKASEWMQSSCFVLPTGPVIVLVGSFFAGLSLFFSPGKGLVLQKIHHKAWKKSLVEENHLKSLLIKEESMTKKEMAAYLEIPCWQAAFFIRKSCAFGWLEEIGGGYVLSVEGQKKAKEIVKRHQHNGQTWLQYKQERGR